MRVRALHAESPRFPAQRKTTQGESAPKARLKSVVDGKQVKIPVLILKSEGRTKKAILSVCWKWRFNRIGMVLRQIRAPVNAEARVRPRVRTGEVVNALLPRKVSKRNF